MEKIINNLKKKNKEIEEAIIELFEFYNVSIFNYKYKIIT